MLNQIEADTNETLVIHNRPGKTRVMQENNAFQKDESIDHAHVLSVIEDLRKQLLDFSTRNDLINLTHSDRSTKFIRVVDELPNQLYGRR